MAISDNYAPIIQQGNGSTVDFSGTWAVINAAYIRVYLEVIATGVLIPQVLGSNFTLAFDNAGFTVTFGAAPTNIYNVVIGREVSLDQTVPYTTSRGFQGKVIENSYDKLTAITQDLGDGVARSLKFKLGSTANNIFPEPSAGLFIGWNAAGTALENKTSLVGPTGPQGPAGPPVPDGDKGDIIVSASGATWTIDNGVISTAKIANNAVDGTKIALGSDAQGDIMYYSGTDYVRLPKGTALQQLRINAGATAPEWVTVSSAGWLSDPASYKYYSDDFKGKTLAVYDQQTVGSGAQVLLGQEIIDVQTGSTTTGGANCNASIVVPAGKLGNLSYASTAAVGIALSDGTNTYTARWGYADGATGANILQSDPSNGIYFRYTHGVNSGNIQAVSRAAGVETVINTSVPPPVYTYNTALSTSLRFEVNAAATSIEFFVNGVSVGTITTNIPSVYLTVVGVGIKKSAGTANRSACLYNQLARVAR